VARLCPDLLGELKRSPDSLAAISGSFSKGKGREGIEREGKGGRRKGRGCPPPT